MLCLLIPLLVAPALPVVDDGFVRLPVVYVCDSATDVVWRLVDFDGDGGMNGDGEATIFYDEDVGSFQLGNPCALALASDGTLYLNDSTQDQVYRLVDLNGDGDAHDPGEHSVFFDGSTGANSAGLSLSASLAMDVDANDRLWLCNSDSGAGSSPDCIYWIEDQNGDGDAMDAGESFIYYQTPTGGGLGDSAPSSLRWGADGRLYYVENGYTGWQPKGIYVLEDRNLDGVIDPLLEAGAFYLPPAHPTSGAYYVLEQDAQENWYLPDLISHELWRLKDGNGDGLITHDWEAEVAWAPAQSQIWGMASDNEGAFYLAESANPDRVLRLEDHDWDGNFSGSDIFPVYHELVSSANIAGPRAITIGALWVPGAVVCDGGPGSACPCGNTGDVGHGCSNSAGTGAQLSGFGEPRTAADNYVLRVKGLPALQTGIFLQGAGVLGAPFRDGLLCVASPTVRLESATADGGGHAQSAGSIIQLGEAQPGQTRVYQFWYRDPGGTCGTGSNFSNGWSVDWD